VYDQTLQVIVHRVKEDEMRKDVTTSSAKVFPVLIHSLECH
jgi:hypothetical protein